MSEILPSGEQADGSVVDKYGNVMCVKDQLTIMERIGGLPVVEYKERVLSTIGESRITIIQAPTGSGKTTQIPKWLAVEGGFREKIVVTQPRRLAAVSNASRVSQELLAEYGNPNFSLGEKVGYRTGTGVSSARTSPLSFNTSGLELMREMFGNIHPDVLIMDEIHGFDVPTEFLGMMARETMRKTSSKMRLILMSATLDPAIFQEYYRDIDSDIPVIQIPGRTYPVQHYYEDGSNITGTILDLFEKGENILVFASGKKEIDDTIASLKKILGEDAPVFPLHADMNKEDQQILLTNKTGKPRIIISTNVAEESITIDYATVVIDLGRHKVSSYSHLGIPELRLRTISDANRLQRAGRVGRTSPGTAIWKNDTLVEDLEPFSEAPIEKEMLDRYILLCLEDDKDIMELSRKAKKEEKKLFFHDFDERLFSISLKRLEQLGAITRERKVTSLGRELLTFPVDVYHAAILLESIQRGCTANMVYAVAILEKRGFLSKEDTWKEIKIPKIPEGDIFVYIEILKIITATKLTPKQLENLAHLGVNRDSLEAFQKGDGKYKLYELVDLSPVGIKNKNVVEIDALVQELLEKLKDLDIPVVESRKADDLKVALSAGSLHMVFGYDPETKKFYHRDHRGENPISFKQGNISTITPSEKSLYLGSPFIIGGSDGDLALVTFLTPVDEGHLKSVSKHLDALIANERFSGARDITMTPKVREGTKTETGGVGHTHTLDKKAEVVTANQDRKIPSGERKKEDTIKGGEIATPSAAEQAIDELTRTYARGLEIYERGMGDNTFETSESAQEYYLQHLLPDFMIAHNKSVQKYLAGKSSDQIAIFRQLLIRVLLVSEKSRIRTKSLTRTESSFRDDTSIMQTFEESRDPYIVAFREGRPLRVAPQKEIIPVELQETSKKAVDTVEVMGLKRNYAKLVGKLKGKREKMHIDTLVRSLIEEYITYLEDQSMTYNDLRSNFTELYKIEEGELENLIKELKKLKHAESKIAKLRDEKGRLLSQEGEEVKTDLKQMISANIGRVDGEILTLLRKRNMEDMPLARAVHESIARICIDFFEEEYARSKILPHILEVTRKVVRDKITGKDGLRVILSDFLTSKDLRKANHTVGEYFQQVYEYITDTDIQGDYYEKIAYEEVTQSSDVAYLETMCKKLTEYIQSSGEAKNRLNMLRDAIRFSAISLDALTGDFGRFEIGEIRIPKKRVKKIVSRDPAPKQRRVRPVDTVRITEIISAMQGYRKYYDDVQASLIEQRIKIAKEQDYRKNSLVPPRSKYNKKSNDELKALMEENRRLTRETQDYIIKHSSTLLGSTPENLKQYKELAKKISQLPKGRSR